VKIKYSTESIIAGKINLFNITNLKLSASRFTLYRSTCVVELPVKNQRIFVKLNEVLLCAHTCWWQRTHSD